MSRQTSPFGLCLLIALTGCGTTRHDSSESGASGGSNAGGSAGSVTAGGASSGGASSGGASSGGASSGGAGGGGAGGAGAGNVDGGSGGNGVGGSHIIPTLDGEPTCSAGSEDIATGWCQSAGCNIAELYFLYCDAALGTVDFFATSPDDVYFVATATAMKGPMELPMTLEQVYVIEKHGEAFSVELGPQTNGACRIGLLDGDVVLACTDGGSVSYSRRSGGTWQTETVAVADATLDTLIVSDDGSVTISAVVAAADAMTFEFVRYHRDAQGTFSSQVLDTQGPGALTLDANSVPVWVTWRQPNDYELLLFQAESTPTLLGTSVKFPGPVGFAPWGSSVAPVVVASGDRPVAYLPGDDGYSELLLTDPPVDETTCPRESDSGCAGVDTMCNWYVDSYDEPSVVATETHGTLIAYRLWHHDSDRHVYNCTDGCLCESDELVSRSYEAFIIAQLPQAPGGAITTLLTLYDSELRAPDKMMATGETLHMMYGSAYLTLDMSGL